METRFINSFLTVAELKSFTRAAEEMHFSQSTVSNQIKQLESELGYPLFDRIGNKVDLTPSGLLFREHAREILTHLNQIKLINAEPTEMIGTLRVGCIESLIYKVMMHCIPSIRAIYPKIGLRVRVGYSSTLKDLLRQNLCDVICLLDDMNDDPQMDLLYSHKEPFHFFAASNHALANKHHLPVDEALAFPLLGVEEGSTAHRNLLRISSSFNTPLNYSFTIENLQALTTLLCQGSFVCFAPDYYFQEQLIQNKLVQLDVAIPNIFSYCQVLCMRNKWRPVYFDSLIELIQNCYDSQN